MTDVSRETKDRLLAFQKIVEKWNPKINLIGPSTLSDFTNRHVHDSLQLLDAAPEDPETWVDLGSGGGFPALVLAIACVDRPTSFSLIESDQRKAAFLRAACRDLGLEKVIVLAERIELAQPRSAQVVSARALAPLPRLIDYVARHMRPNGVALLPKGRGWHDELLAARAIWKFRCEAIPSKTDPEAAILKISGVTHA